MATSFLSSTRSFFANLWGFIDSARRTVLNLLFLLIVIAIIVAVVKGGAPALDDKTTLVLALKGPIVEQRGGSVRDNALAQARGDAPQSVQLRDLLAVLDTAAKDPKIVRVLLQLDELRAAGLPVLREVAGGIERFKASGKPVVAWGSGFDQRQYYLAAHANEVWMHPLGALNVTGFGGYRNYYRDALDKLGVTVNLVRVGTYKSAAEPFIANGPSPAAKEATRCCDLSRYAPRSPGQPLRSVSRRPSRRATVLACTSSKVLRRSGQLGRRGRCRRRPYW